MENRIRELRKSRKMTMKQLGQVVGLAESTISQYETGKRQPDNETLFRLGEFFGVTVDYLLGAKELIPSSNNSPDIPDEIADIFSQLSDTNKEKLLELAKMYVDSQKK